MPVDWSEFEEVAPAAKTDPKHVDWSEFEEAVPDFTAQTKRNELEDAANARMTAGQSDFTRTVLTQLPKDIGHGVEAAKRDAYDAAAAYAFETIAEPGLQMAQLKHETDDQGRTPIEQGAAALPMAGQVLASATKGAIETAPQIAATAGLQALGIPAPLAAAGTFGFTSEGFSPKQAAVAAALPFVGKLSGAVAEYAAAKAGISSAKAMSAINKLGGAAGAVGLLTATQINDLLKLPPEQRQQAYVNLAGNAASMALLGTLEEPSTATKNRRAGYAEQERLFRQARERDDASRAKTREGSIDVDAQVTPAEPQKTAPPAPTTTSPPQPPPSKIKSPTAASPPPLVLTPAQRYEMEGSHMELSGQIEKLERELGGAPPAGQLPGDYAGKLDQHLGTQAGVAGYLELKRKMEQGNEFGDKVGRLNPLGMEKFFKYKIGNLKNGLLDHILLTSEERAERSKEVGRLQVYLDDVREFNKGDGKGVPLYMTDPEYGAQGINNPFGNEWTETDRKNYELYQLYEARSNLEKMLGMPPSFATTSLKPGLPSTATTPKTEAAPKTQLKPIVIDDLPVTTDFYEIIPKDDPDPLGQGFSHGKFYLSPDNRWISVEEHEDAARQLLGKGQWVKPSAREANPNQAKLELQNKFLRVIDEETRLYFAGNPLPSQLVELLRIAKDYGRELVAADNNAPHGERVIFTPKVLGEAEPATPVTNKGAETLAKPTNQPAISAEKGQHAKSVPPTPEVADTLPQKVTDAKGRSPKRQQLLDQMAKKVKESTASEPALPVKILTPANVATTADVATAQTAKPLGTSGDFSPKVAREQKKFLLDATEQAIAEAPATSPVSEADTDLAAFRSVQAFQSGDDEAKFQARRAAVLTPLLKKYAVPEGHTGYTPSVKSLTGEPIAHLPLGGADAASGNEPPRKYTDQERADLLENEIKKAAFAAKPKVTIEVPGDGTFDVINTKSALAEFKQRAAKFPTSAARTGKPPTARSQPTAPIALGKPDRENILKALAPVLSTDATRSAIWNIWSDGKQSVATNGRMLTLINQGIGGTVKKPILVAPDGKPGSKQNFPNWQQIVPDKFLASAKNLDTAKFFTLLKQAQQTTTERSNSVKLYQNKDGTIGIISGDVELASYASNVDSDSNVIGNFDPQYLLNAINAARQIGDERVELSHTDDLSPIQIKSPHTMSIIMPMRGGAGPSVEEATSNFPAKPNVPSKPGSATGSGKTGKVLGFGGSSNPPSNPAPATPSPSNPPAPPSVATSPAQVAALQNQYTPGLFGGVKTLLLPSSKSPEHLREAERLGGKLGAMHRRQEAAIHQLAPASRYFDRLGVHRDDLAPADNPGIQFMSALSQGKTLTGPPAQFANQVEKLFADRVAKLEAAGAPLKTVRDHYFPGMWTAESRRAFNAALADAQKNGVIPKDFDPNTASASVRQMIKAQVDKYLAAGEGSDNDMLAYFTRSPLAGRESFRKQKLFDDILTGAEFGLRPISNNPIDLVKGKLAEMDKSIMAHEEFQSLKQAGKLETINPYEQVPEGWVKVNDKYGTMYGPPTVTISEHIDKAVYEGLLDVAAKLGIKHERSMNFPPGPGNRALGLSYQGQDFVRTKFGTETSVLAHEIGHQLDVKYDLWNNVLRTAGKRGQPGKGFKSGRSELRAIADLTGNRGGNPRSKEEKIAQMVEAYIHAPEKMSQVAPRVFKWFDNFVKTTPELKALADIKPGIELTKLTSEKYVGLPIIGYRIVPQATGDILNNYLSSSLYNNRYFGGLYRGWMGAANALNQAQLGIGSAFHAGFTTLDAQVSAGGDLLKDVFGLARGNRTPADLAKSAARWSVASINTAVTGDKILNAWRNPDGVIDPKISNVVKAAELAGGGFKLEAGLKTDQTTKLLRHLFSGHQVRAALRSPIAFTELMAKPILEYLVPRQKAGVFASLANRIIEQNPGVPLEELQPQFRQAWNRVDARLGQVRYDRLFAHNTAKGIIQGLVRAPGWSGGTIAEIGGSVPDLAKFFQEWQQTGKAPANMPDRVAYILSLLLTVGIVNAAMTYAFTGQTPHGMDFMAFRDGTKDQYGNENRWLLPSYMKDLLSYAIRPGDTLFAKTHPALAVIIDVLKNRDYYGYEIRNPHADKATQAGQVAGYVVKSFVPFWIRGLLKADQSGAPNPAKLAPYFGVMPAPGYVTMSPVQREISDLFHKRTGQPVKPYGTQGNAKKNYDKTVADIYMFNRLPESDKEALRKKMTPEELNRYQ